MIAHGRSAVSTAVSISGFSEKYFFYGFFPSKLKDMKSDLKLLSQLDSSIVFFISSKKMNKAIPFLKEIFSEREILICREMTKIYEEYIRLSVNNIETANIDLRGEITLVFSPILSNSAEILDESDKKKIKKIIKKSSIRDIVSLISKEKKISKKDIYDYCLKLKNEK